MGKFIICKVKAVHPIYLLGLATFFLISSLVFVLILNHKVFAADSNPESGRDHVVTIYDNDIEKTIITKASTVKDSLKDADVSVGQYDSIDPSVDSKLEDGMVIINIRRARPILVIDGQRQVRVITAAQSASDIAKTANIQLYAEDQTTLSPVDDILASGGAGLELNIHRAKVLNMHLYGQEILLRTQSKTVAELLREKQISLGPDDGMNLSPNTLISEGMNLQVWRNGIQTINSTEQIAFATKTVQDSTKNVGYKEVQTAGQNGEKTVVYQIEMRDGKEISRTVISEVVNNPAVDQVVIVGTKVSLPPGSYTDWMSAAGMSSNDYGYINSIFTGESGWRPGARNPSGKYVGLGQTSEANLSRACPNWQSDPICQIRFFDGYAKSRYGSWSAAQSFRARNNWW